MLIGVDGEGGGGGSERGEGRKRGRGGWREERWREGRGDAVVVKPKWNMPLPGGRGAYSSVACLSHLALDHASLSRRSTVPTPNRDTSNIWALITLLPCIT